MSEHHCKVGDRVIVNGEEVEVAAIVDTGAGWHISVYFLHHGKPRQNCPRYIGNEWEFIGGQENENDLG